MCTSGSCGYACDGSHLDCDGAASDGCEVDPSTDIDNCGACGMVCSWAPPNSTAACTSGTCGYTCTGTYLDCDGSSSNGCEADTANDPYHCGSCDRCPTHANATASCTGGSCSYTCISGTVDCGGTCVSLSNDADNCGACGNVCGAGPNPGCGAGLCYYTLATGLTWPWGIATDGSYVYWTNEQGASGGPTGSVEKVAIDGTGLALLASGQLQPEDIVVRGGALYWVNNEDPDGSVMKVATDGTGLTTLVSGQSNPNSLATDGTYVFWTNDTGLERMLTDGSGVLGIATGPYAQGVVTDGVHVYCSLWDRLDEMAIDGSAHTTVYTPTYPHRVTAIALEGSYVDWIDRNLTGSSADSAVKRQVALPGGVPATFASTLSAPLAIATDGTYVYWGDNLDGTIQRIRTDGTGLVTLASGMHPRSIAIDATRIYWTDDAAGTVGGGSVRFTLR